MVARAIPPLTPEEVDICLAARISTDPRTKGRTLAWRTIAWKLSISPHRVLQHFAPEKLPAYRALLKAARSRMPGVPRQKKPERKTNFSEEEMELIVKGFCSGMSARWCADRLGDGVGKIMVAKLFATLGEAHGEARKAALAKPKVRDRQMWLITGVRPHQYFKSEKPSARPPAHVIADRDRRAQRRAECMDPNVLLLGDPV